MSFAFRNYWLLLIFVSVIHAEEPKKMADYYPTVQIYLDQRVTEFDQIPAERQEQLKKISLYIQRQHQEKQPANLTFICTHNSRRSHLAQIWAATAASYYGIGKVATFSGGTEATAFNSRAIAALERAGMKVKQTEEGKNPHYSVSYQDEGQGLDCFSKVYNQKPNPAENFCAVLTCADADKSFPTVTGSSMRIAIPYEDPKVADGTAEEAAKYDERSRQICREMLFLFSEVAQ